MRLPDFDKKNIAPYSPPPMEKKKEKDRPKSETSSTDSQVSGQVTIISGLLGSKLPLSWDDRAVTVGSARYTLEEIAVMKLGMSPAVIKMIHELKSAFGGSLVSAGKAKLDQKRVPYNPIECWYGGVKRDAHPEVCKWHQETKDPNCEKCARKR